MSVRPRRRLGVLKTIILGALIVLAGAGAGFGLVGIVPAGTLISVFKYSTILLGVVWAFSMVIYNKLSDLTDLPAIDYKQHRGLESAIQLRLHWFWYRATMLAFAGLAANLPMFLKDGGIAPSPWAFAVAAGSLALAMFLLRRVWIELEDIRELRSEVKELERREKQRSEQIRDLKDEVAGWEVDHQLDGLGRTAEIDGKTDKS